MYDLNFKSYSDLAQEMIKLAHLGNDITVPLLYDEAKLLIRELSACEDVDIRNIEFRDVLFCGYEKEFYVSLTNQAELFVEPAWREENKWRRAGYCTVCESIILLNESIRGDIENAFADCTVVHYGMYEVPNEFNDAEYEEEYKSDLADVFEYLIEHLIN